MNILSVFVLFVILLKCIAASEDTLGDEFRKAVDEANFEWLRTSRRSWKGRKDLFDHVIGKGADHTVRFIEGVGDAKRRVFAALFDKGERGMIYDVLRRVGYKDKDLRDLTDYRPELAGSPEKFLRILGKMRRATNQALTVQSGVTNLFKVGRYDLVVPLVDALGERTFKSKCLKEVAIQRAFYEGADRGIQSIAEEYCHHPLLTSLGYADGLIYSWNSGKPNQVFPFLLEHADKDDLEAVKEEYGDDEAQQFRQVIDEALKTAPSTGTRHSRFVERTKAIEETSVDTVPLKTFPPPIQVAFDNKGVPILADLDPTQVPITGLSIPERVERVKGPRKLGRKKEADVEASTEG